MVRAAQVALQELSAGSGPAVAPLYVQMHHFLRVWTIASAGLVADLLRLHAAVTEFSSRSLSVYFDLFRNGLCLPPEAAPGEEKSGEGSKGDGAINALGEGTGMGSGTGVQDVSKEITHEEQVGVLWNRSLDFHLATLCVDS
jgi:midasin (ATPase involved in ribosome maturation)